jgi:hypothetical protein
MNRRILQRLANSGLLKLTRHGLAMLGLLGLALAMAFTFQPEWRQTASHQLLGLLESRLDSAPDPSLQTAEEHPLSSLNSRPELALSQEQAAVTQWLSRRYKVSPEPLGALVSEAWRVGDSIQISPTLLLAVMAIESRFNPFASGAQGGMGLMQIDPQAQHQALLPFGGPLAAFDPLTNLRVGARHLQALIEQSASLEAALQLYALATEQRHGGEYVHRVLAEHQRLESMARQSRAQELPPHGRM